MRVEPFSIHVEEEVLTDLRERVRKTRWPDPAPGDPWEQGTDLDYLRHLLAYWADEFDWRAQERELNAFLSHAGIGAATAFGLVLVVGGGALGLRATDGQQKRP